jgi:Flp pilus assembly protein TadG
MFGKRGTVSVLFAASAVPLLGCVGLAIDFSFWNQANIQLQTAADSAAVSSVRTAIGQYLAGNSDWSTQGETNGTQWFAAQLGQLNVAVKQSSKVDISLQDTKLGTQITSTVSYTALMKPFFGQLFGITSYPITGSSVAQQAVRYVNIALMLDNSSSMLIGATTDDINVMQQYTPCSLESANAGQGLSSWTGQTPACVPPPGQTVQAPCGFACHSEPNTGTDFAKSYDYYYLARHPEARPPSAPKTKVTLRFDVVQSASAEVVNQMIAYEQKFNIPNQFGLTAFTFNNALTKVYPQSGEYSTDLASGATAITGITTPQVFNAGDTDFPDSMINAAASLSDGGGGAKSAPQKFLFLVTDGIQDYADRTPGGTMGPISTKAAIDACDAMKAKNISIYVLYTEYTPLPFNPFYSNNIAQFVDSGAITNALQACASKPEDYFVATSAGEIKNQLKKMLAKAVGAPASII